MTFHNITNLQNGVMEGSLEGIYSKAIGIKSVALGENTLAGAKAFKVKATVSGGYELDTENIGKIAVGDKFSIYLKQNYDFSLPLRSVTITLDHLINETDEIQLSLFEDVNKRKKTYDLEVVIDQIRSHYGFNSVKRCSMLMDGKLTDFNPKGDHVIFPVSYF